MDQRHMSETLRDFELYLTKGNKSDHSRRMYLYWVQQLIHIVNDKPISELSAGDLSAGKLAVEKGAASSSGRGRPRNDTKAAPSTLALVLAAWRAYGIFLARECHIIPWGPDDFEEIRPKIKRKTKEAPDWNWLSEAYKKATDPRDRLIIMLLIKSGRRINEVLSIDFKKHRTTRVISIGGVPTEVPALAVPGKGGKETIFYLHDKELIAELEIYLEQRRQRPPQTDDSRLFHLSYMTVWARLRRLAQAIESEQEDVGNELARQMRRTVKLNPHAFRTFFATDMHSKGVGIRTIQTMLGHSSIETTAGYVSVDEAQVVRTLEENRRVLNQ